MILFRSELQAFRTSCGRSLVSPQPGWFEYAMPGYGSWGYERMSESAMKPGARWQSNPQSGVRSGAERICCFLHIVDLEVNLLSAIYRFSIMLIDKGWCFVDPLYCSTVTVAPHMALSFSPRSAVLSCILTSVIHTDSNVCVF